MRLLFSSLLILSAWNVKAATLDDKYLTIAEVSIEETPSQTLEMNAVPMALNPLTGGLDEIEKNLDQIINIGKKVWMVIEAGRPTINVQNTAAMAMPLGATSWRDLENWQRPVAKSFTVTMKNGYGMEVIHFTYAVNYIYGGSVEGAGRYIGYAVILPTVTTVAYGFGLDVIARVPVTMNLGTKQSPIAGMQMDIEWTVTTVAQKTQVRKLYSIDGLGRFSALN